ncbi:MAG: phosphoenolpyruvate--protein phosphotransferase [Gammaproteobacteria bacterium]|nr:phosphoenolpyruvate--protein phosphotransferase [Gammaproteobacteria bacterium]
MLAALRRIVKKVSHAESLDEALQLILDFVQETLKVDACSVYLAEQESEQPRWVLSAAEGFNCHAVGEACLAWNEGLIGLVAERAEPVNLQHAAQHPRYCYLPDIGEESFEAFLAVPIIHRRKVLGVLVVQQRESRRFGEDTVAFLLTLAAQLAIHILQAIVGDEVSPSRENKKPSSVIHGLSGASGVAIGEAVVLYSPAALERVPDREIVDIEAEITRFRAACEAVQAEITVLAGLMQDKLPAEELALFDAYKMMLKSEDTWQPVIEGIRKGNWAPGALRDAIEEYSRLFAEIEDPYLRERASDVRDLGKRILMQLQDKKQQPTVFPAKTIIVGDEISATQLAEVPHECLKGMVSRSGSGSSHVAILARALGIPTVMGATEMPSSRLEGRSLVIDGYRGHVFIDPSAAVRNQFAKLAKEERELSHDLEGLMALPTVTPDGVSLSLFANTGLQAEINPQLLQVADGIGLYRTEVPFQVRSRFPSEAEQCEIYRAPLEAFAPRPVVLRTLDIGADKQLPYFPIEEENPALGWRGIRVTLDHPEIFLTQIRAMLKASEGLDNLSILLPMISRVEEVMDSTALIWQAHQELLDEGVEAVYPRIGVMVEVPSAIYQIAAIAKRVDFISVGTNDLTQYLMAVDRNNARVAELYDSLHPAVLNALMHLKTDLTPYNKPLGICGEIAGDPLGALLFLGMGVDSLSVSGSSLLRVKWVIRSFTVEKAQQILAQALILESSTEVRLLLERELEQAGLGGLIRAGKH